MGGRSGSGGHGRQAGVADGGSGIGVETTSRMFKIIIDLCQRKHMAKHTERHIIKHME